jgi:hypothetical protein
MVETIMPSGHGLTFYFNNLLKNIEYSPNKVLGVV